MDKRKWQVRFNRRESVIYNFITGKKLRGGTLEFINEKEFEEIQRNKYFTITSFPKAIPDKKRETVNDVFKDVLIDPDTGCPVHSIPKSKEPKKEETRCKKRKSKK